MCCWIKVVHLHNLTTTDDEKSTYKQNPCTLKSIEPASSTNLVCLISTGSCHSLIYAYPKIFFSEHWLSIGMLTVDQNSLK